jgi:hypothetical protein
MGVPVLTLEAATHHVDVLARQALAQLPPAEATKIASDPTPCTDPTDGGPPGRFTAVAQYEVALPGDVARHFDVLFTWWIGNRFHVLKDARPKYLWVERTMDGFRMTAQANDAGEFFVTATSPCVWP